MRKIIYFSILIGAFVIIGCNNNNNMMGSSRNRNRSNMKSKSNMMTTVYCNSNYKDCITNISTNQTQAQQDTAKQKCSDSVNSCMMMGGTATMMK